MKKLLPILLSLLLLSACVSGPSISGDLPKGTSETVTEPERAPAGTTETSPAEPEKKPAEPAEDTPADPPEEAPEAPQEETPEAPQAVTILVYYGNDNADALVSREAELPALSPEAVAGELIAVGILPEGTLVNRLEVIGPYLYLDLSYEFFAKLQTMGTSGEWIMVGSVTNTFLEAYGAEALLLTANGAIIETGHVVYDEPLTRFENPEIISAVDLTVYYGNDNADQILSKTVQVAEITPDVLVEQLIAAGVLPEGCEILDMTQDGAAIYADFNDAFRAHVCTMGTSGEWIILSSVTNTFLDAFDGEKFHISVSGSLLETGHNVYDFPLAFTAAS